MPLTSNGVTLTLLWQCAVSNNLHSRAFSVPLHNLSFIFGQFQVSSSQTVHIDDCSPLSDTRDLHGLSQFSMAGIWFEDGFTLTLVPRQQKTRVIGGGNGILMEPV